MDLTKMGMIQLQNPSHPTGLLCKANQMRLAGTLCDVVIMVDSQEFHAHRTVLACTSKMFEILFHRNSQHYTLDFLSPKTFQQILEYAYTATLQAKAEDLDDLLYAAEILEIEYLEEQCLKILETIQASDDNDTEATMADGGAEEEEDRKARYLKNIFISKHSSEESGYASVAAQSLPGPVVDQSPSVSTSFGLSAMSPTKAAVDSLMTIGQSLLQGALQLPARPEEPTLAGVGRHPAVAEVKPEMMQVDEVPGQDSPGTAESSLSAGMGDKVEERGKEGPGTPTRSSVITSARELHYGREESAEQLPPLTEVGQGPPGRPEPPAPPAEKHLGIYSVLPNHKADAVLSMPSSVTSGLHVQPTLAVSMDFSTYGGLLPQGFIQRELFSKLGELAVGMKAESRTVGEQCSVCGVELPDNEAVEQHRYFQICKFYITPDIRGIICSDITRKLHSGMKTYGCELCGKRFLDSLRLRMHLLAHSAGAKAFVCDQCGAQFSKEDALETHRQTHTAQGSRLCWSCLLWRREGQPSCHLLAQTSHPAPFTLVAPRVPLGPFWMDPPVLLFN
ncbi:zinc finger and BTB domain-containing protein 16 isoform X3 [Physeter macrocephalus]|uniref:Zinc finger and BTB domain-containing protein 16 isoform X3 n=1 Tax=Physeter macrocephalus TaxID=9755 RepID=A0A455AR12_PHYMC|nr:zinc finger and BTB domain-containing protein 16 isoform X3 [Physeter catodon]|eukprot:XP_028339012.1 zinc finger and BTB domain-containing protein 16 isoform X3 [Physeter catodon]